LKQVNKNINKNINNNNNNNKKGINDKENETDIMIQFSILKQ
jgi:hypothetical protein